MNSTTRLFYAVILALGVIILLGRYAARHYDPSRKAFTAYPLPSRLLNELGISRGQSMIIIAAKAECPYCEKSRKFYGELAEKDAMISETHLVFVMPDPEVIARGFLPPLASREIRWGVMLWRLGVDAAPTILEVDDRGRVCSRWVGLLNRRQEDEVMLKLAVLQHRFTSAVHGQQVHGSVDPFAFF